MVVIMKREFTPEQLEAAVHTMEEGGVKVMVSKGAETTILGAEGNAEHIDQEKLSLLPGVERVMRVSEPYKKANRKYHPDDTVISLPNGAAIGGKKLAVIAGPCSVESENQIVGIAKEVQKSGACALRGGAFKPRTSPYSFQGLECEGLELLRRARRETGLPVVTEIMSTEYIDLFQECVDVIQVGARNMQNFDLLKSWAGRPINPFCSSGASPPPLKSGSCPPSTSWPGAIRTSSSASVASAPLRPSPATPWTCPPCWR